MSFRPLSHDPDDTESRTGLWMCPRLERSPAGPAVGTRLYATQESVTGGVALRIAIPRASRGTVTFEPSPLPAGSAGITLYARASEPLAMTIQGRAPLRVEKAWRKHDVSWAALGATPEAPSLGAEFTLALAEPAPRDVWVLVDRLGTEGPRFEAAPAVSPTRGRDAVINTWDLVGNAAVLLPTVRRLRAWEPFRIVAFGDSVTAGAQSFRGNWDLKDAAPRFLYFSRLARGLEGRYGGGPIACVQKGYGGWTAEQAKTVVGEIVRELGPHDLFILQFGANDLGWADHGVDRWLKNLRDLVLAARAKTDQILVMTPTVGGKIPEVAPEISRRMRRFAADERVAFADITRWSLYRGEPYSWAYLANEYHPDFAGHAMIGEILLPLFTGTHFDWPPYAARR